MNINGAMYAGVSGLGAEGETLGLVGENIANANTIGFKRSRATFENVLGGAVGASEYTSGGVRLARPQQIFAQGALVNTGQPTDIALSGDGFFVVHGTVGGVTGDFFTRAGQLTVRNDGVVVNPQGMAVQGYDMQSDGAFSTTIGSIRLTTAQLPPKPTKTVTITANLDAGASKPAVAFDPQNPGPGANLSTSVTVYDSLGKAHSIDMCFCKTAAGTWDVHALAKGDELASGPAGQNVEIGTGTLTFDSSGALQDVQWATPIRASFVDAATMQPIDVGFGDPTAAGGSGLAGTTQFGSVSGVSAQSQDGHASGDLAGVNIDANGVVSGVYSNGQTVAAGRISVARFRSEDGLARVGQNLWMATKDSGDAALGSAGEGGRGTVVSGTLEQSNVDIAEQFVELIAHQRAFQANSKTITTADQMIQELMAIKQ